MRIKGIPLILIAVITIIGGYLLLSGRINPSQNQNIELTNWQTYTNKQYGVSFKYPPNWKIKSQNTNIGIAEFEGYEGNIIIKSTTTEINCPDTSEKIKIQLGLEELPSCHRYTLGKDLEAWEQINKKISEDTYLQIQAWAYSPIDKNRNYVLKIFSTFEFIK